MLQWDNVDVFYLSDSFSQSLPLYMIMIIISPFLLLLQLTRDFQHINPELVLREIEL